MVIDMLTKPSANDYIMSGPSLSPTLRAMSIYLAVLKVVPCVNATLCGRLKNDISRRIIVLWQRELFLV